MDKMNYTAPLSTQQLFIGLNKRFRGSESSPIYVNPEDISLIEPSWDDGTPSENPAMQSGSSPPNTPVPAHLASGALAPASAQQVDGGAR